jgi:DNA-binding CsgD family transcriptional regulator
MMLLEREDALRELSRALTASRTLGQFASVSGEAGVGKTALVAAFVAREPGVVPFLWGACDALATPRPLGPLLDMAHDVGGDLPALVAAEAARHQLFAAFVAGLGRRKTPALVVFEDVHWADAATLDLLRYVGRRATRIRALIVLTWRSDEVGADHPLNLVLGELPPGSTHRLVLRPLSLESVAQMAGGSRDAKKVFALTGGNPFYVTELLRADGDTVPASVREAILARRAALPIESRHLLDLVSVVPGRTEIEIVRARVASADEGLKSAVDVGLLTFDGRAVAYRHELARLAVLESLPRQRAQELHRQVLLELAASFDGASVLARLVHHAAGAAQRDAVQSSAAAAARHASAMGAHAEAAAHYRTALAWAEGVEPAARAEILDLLAYECYIVGDMTAARDARLEALALWRSLDRVAEIGRDVRWLSRLAWFLGDFDGARERALEALEVVLPLGDGEDLAWTLSNCAQLHMLAHEHEPCLAFGERAIAMARAIGAVDALSHALNNVGTSQAVAGDPVGWRLLEESLTLALEHNLHEHAARAFTNLATVAVRDRDYDAARKWLDRGLQYTTERDMDSWGLYLLASHARLQAETGQWGEAESEAQSVIASPRATAVARIPALTVLGLLHARQRQPDARALLDEALALAVPTGESQRLVPVRAARAELEWLLGNADAVRAEADAGLAALTPTDSYWYRERLSYLKWRADASPGRPGKRSGGAAKGPHGMSMRGQWHAAADAWERQSCPYERAEALADGDIPAMEEALQVFLTLGAAAAADRVRQELRRAGVTRFPRGPRASTRAHPGGLTQREVEILALLARGLSNPAIGEQLFVSAKTVEHHVSSILAKLEVATREEAVEEARRRGWLDPPRA